MQEVSRKGRTAMTQIAGMILLFSVLAGTSTYIAWRLYQGLAAFCAQLRFWPILVAVCLVTLLLVLGFVRGLTPFPKNVKQFLGLVSAYCMGIFLYLLLFTVAADVLLLLPRICKLPFTTRPLFKGFVTLGVLALTAATCIYGFFNARQIDHVTYEITLQDKQDISDLNVALISDLHLGAVGSEARLQEIVDQINGLQPDVVCIAGDFFDTDFASIQAPQAAIRILQGLRATYGTYACLGNHDAGNTYGQMVEFLKEANIHLLSDDYAIIDDRLILIGRLDASPIGSFGEEKRQPLSDFFAREDASIPVIVLDHNPARIGEYTNEADLILCGHTHKGQVFPGSLITDSMYEVDYGYYQKDAGSPQVVVTSGVGYWGMPMRVGSDSEIVTIRFSK